MMVYAVVRHRLLNRKIFVSRKVVYSFLVPSLLGAYLLGFGIVSLIMRTFGLEMSYVLKWLFLALGLLFVGFLGFSAPLRRRVHFFISTHFYINKYEYRDEWLALSQELQGASSKGEVVKALRQVLTRSLYTSEIFIWTGGAEKKPDYALVSSPDKREATNPVSTISGSDVLVRYLQNHAYFHRQEQEPDRTWQKVHDEKSALFSSFNLQLLVPVAIGSNFVGIIGLGPEFTGGQYGYDDFDLLTALGSQTASALLAVRMAEELAHAREQQAWDRLSAFVLHDIKNSATMLSLLQENAPAHIHEPEFQRDMLELVADALKRMGRVEQRLGSLREEIVPNFKGIELKSFLEDVVYRMKAKLPDLEIRLDGSGEMPFQSDPELLYTIFENLLLNAYEAQGKGGVVRINYDRDKSNQQVHVEILDNGPGIPRDLLPDGVFEPFKTSKEGGSGIGLWQAKRVATSLRASISAENSTQGGACFVLDFLQIEGVE
jgi:putative PEP-CTERM system histidine kinase